MLSAQLKSTSLRFLLRFYRLDFDTKFNDLVNYEKLDTMSAKFDIKQLKHKNFFEKKGNTKGTALIRSNKLKHNINVHRFSTRKLFYMGKMPGIKGCSW